MNRPPAFQFYPSDWLSNANVSMMTLEEEGAYIRLLSHCWIEGFIPNDDEQISLLAKGASTTVIRVVRKRFKQDPADASRLLNSRLNEEREKQLAWREKSRAGGIKSGQVRSKSTTKKREQYLKGGSSGAVEPNGNSSVFSLQSSSPNKNIKDFPEWLPMESWEAFVEMRRKIPRAPWTDKAQQFTISKLTKLRAQGLDPRELLESATVGSWRTVYEPKNNGGGNGNGNGHRKPGIIEAIRDSARVPNFD